tara:strand:- start:1492 stop:2301 length:810 start_codon:yes stop_codon:yes gene_type:complete
MNSTSPKILILDNDECTGQYGLLTILFNIYKHFRKDVDIDQLANFMIDNYLSPTETSVGAFRPYFKEFLDEIRLMIDSGKIDELVIYTAASNANNWVGTLTRCIEIYGGFKEGQIRYISGEYIEEFDKYNCPIKDFNTCVRTSHLDGDIDKCFMIDDKIYQIKQYDTEYYSNLCSVEQYHGFVNPMRFLSKCPFWDILVENRIFSYNDEEEMKKGHFKVSTEDMKHPVGMALSAINYDSYNNPWTNIDSNNKDDTSLIRAMERIKEFYR